MDEYSRSNRKLWDEWTRIRAQSDFYHLDEFKAGKNVLNSLERDEVDDVGERPCCICSVTLAWIRFRGHAWAHR